MRRSINSLSKSTSKLKSPRSEEIINNFLFKESEIVAKNIIEKVISLVISTTYDKMIEKKIPNFCIMKIINKLDKIIDIQFIKHDKDDLGQKRNMIKTKSEKLILYKSNEQNNLLLTEEKIMNKKLNESLDFPNYELINDLNLYGSSSLGNKTVLNILSKTKINIQKKRNDLSFSSDNKEQENNENKLDEPNIMNNFWDTIFQPKTAKIDRGAATKIKIDKVTFKNLNSRCIEENIKEEDPNNKQLENKANNTKLVQKKKLKKIFKQEKESEKKDKKIKIQIPTDLPSFDIESEKLGIIEENETIKNLRKEYERRLLLKKEREEREKLLMKQRKLSELEEENNAKKKLVDSKVNTVKIKPIKIEKLVEEFQALKYHSKEISKVTDPNMASYSQRKKSKIEIEINENPNYQFSDERTDRKRRKYINQSNNNLINPNSNIKKIKKEKNFLEKSGSKYASGSNFDLMKLECGVNLTENRKKKSGGKNYFEKYGKFSFELYQSKLNNTMSDNFMVKGLKEMMDNSIKEEDENENEIKPNLKGFNRKKSILIRQKSDYNANIEMDNKIDNNANNYLNIKTKNLKIVMNNLDLMKDFELNIDRTNKYMPKTKYNFFKSKNINQNFKKNKKDLRDINDFNKTVMKNDFWGEPDNTNTKDNFYTKQPFHFFHKKNNNFPIFGLKRERLPPIYTSKLHNNSMIKNKSGIDFSKEKIRNLSRDNINDEEKSPFLLEHK